MSFEGKVRIDNKEFNIIRLNFSFTQQIDPTGKPCANPAGGIVQVTIDATDDSNLLLQWMISPDSTKDVTIFFNNFEMGKPTKVLLEKAFCVGYQQTFQSYGSNPMTIDLTLSAQKFTSGEATVEKKWPDAKG
jgi:hypothetical protein